MESVFTEESFRVAALVLVKMGIGVTLGGAIGFEREKHGRPAGLRTHMLVALGVVLFTVVSSAYAGSDPTRISAQVVTGVGFLGAGTIMRMGGEIKGLTSAASIWATAAISMAVARGGPYLIVATTSTLIAVVTLHYLNKIEKRLRPLVRPSELYVTLQRRSDLHSLIERFNLEGVEVNSVHIARSEPQIDVELQVSGTGTTALQIACTVHGVTDARWAEGA